MELLSQQRQQVHIPFVLPFVLMCVYILAPVDRFVNWNIIFFIHLIFPFRNSALQLARPQRDSPRQYGR